MDAIRGMRQIIQNAETLPSSRAHVVRRLIAGDCVSGRPCAGRRRTTEARKHMRQCCQRVSSNLLSIADVRCVSGNEGYSVISGRKARVSITPGGQGVQWSSAS